MANAIYRVWFSVVPSGGTWTLTVAGVGTTANIAYNAVAATVQVRLETVVGAGNVLVSGDATGGFVVEFLGGLANTNVGLTVTTTSLTVTLGSITVTRKRAGVTDVPGQPTVFTISAQADGGSFLLTLPASFPSWPNQQRHILFPWNATVEQIANWFAQYNRIAPTGPLVTRTTPANFGSGFVWQVTMSQAQTASRAGYTAFDPPTAESSDIVPLRFRGGAGFVTLYRTQTGEDAGAVGVREVQHLALPAGATAGTWDINGIAVANISPADSLAAVEAKVRDAGVAASVSYGPEVRATGLTTYLLTFDASGAQSLVTVDGANLTGTVAGTVSLVAFGATTGPGLPPAPSYRAVYTITVLDANGAPINDGAELGCTVFAFNGGVGSPAADIFTFADYHSIKPKTNGTVQFVIPGATGTAHKFIVKLIRKADRRSLGHYGFNMVHGVYGPGETPQNRFLVVTATNFVREITLPV